MIKSRKKDLKKSRRVKKSTKSNDPAELEKEQHKASVANAGLIMRQALSTVMMTGLYRSLILLLETVQQWPSLIEKAAPQSFNPEFNAGEISAEEVIEDDDTIINVSFTYAGEAYDFTCRISKDPLDDRTSGAITLLENGVWVIRMDTAKSKFQEQFEFRELKAFRDGSWTENIVQIASEIQEHRERLTKTTD